MRANCWHGKNDVRVETVPDPKILNQTDAIIRITSSAICGSDLHLYGGFVPTMESGDILGHEFMGEVVETGREVKNMKKGRPRGCSLSNRVRAVFLLPKGPDLRMRELESERLGRGNNAGPPNLGRVRVFAYAGRLCRRAGGIRSSALRGREPAESARPPDR